MKLPAKLTNSFYQQEDVIFLARSLLGKVLCSNIGSKLTSGRIVETEAYAGITDRASHAYGGRNTKRTQTLYEAGGIAYVYLCYGMHALFNVVTHKKGTPHAVLIRAIEPLQGAEIMLQRRGKKNIDPSLCSGPGTLTKALGISTKLNGTSLLGNTLWIEECEMPTTAEITASPRIGVDYAKEDALLPWRFCLAAI
jgi:DNA-3-methyladenine glycosylase